MNYCVRCPGNTTTDTVGAYDSEQCKGMFATLASGGREKSTPGAFHWEM